MIVRLHILLLCLTCARALAQTGADDPRRPEKPLLVTVGAMLGANVNFHSAELSSFSTGENGADCARFNSGASVQPAFGLVASLPLSQRYAIHGTLAYEVKSVRFVSDIDSRLVRRDSTIVTVGHVLDVSLSYLTFEALGVYSWSRLPQLKAAAGGAVSVKSTSSIDQKIIETDNQGSEEFSVPLDRTPKFSTVNLSFVGRIFYSMEIVRQAVLDVSVGYEVPLVGVTSSNAERWSVRSLSPRAELRFPL